MYRLIARLLLIPLLVLWVNPVLAQTSSGRGVAAPPLTGQALVCLLYTSNGTSANHAKTLRQGGIGPASGNGNSSKQAESPAAAHGFHVDCIHRRV